MEASQAMVQAEEAPAMEGEEDLVGAEEVMAMTEGVTSATKWVISLASVLRWNQKRSKQFAVM